MFFITVALLINGKILSLFDMYRCCNWLKQIDASSNYEKDESLRSDSFGIGDRFLISACISKDNMDSIQKRGGIYLYYVGKADYIYVHYLNDPYAKKIVNMFLKNWPIKNGERYIERENWLE